VMIDALLAKVHELVRQRVQDGPPPFPPSMFKQTGKKGKGANNYSVKDMLDYLESLTDPDQVDVERRAEHNGLRVRRDPREL